MYTAFLKSIRGVIASRFLAKQSLNLAKRLLPPAKNAGLATAQKKKSRLCKHRDKMYDRIRYQIRGENK